ncbi:MAG: hypothetical protein K2X46_02715 [Roseomonas sp.]|nr:hypothetical protein [Roseomonas sp.]
MSGLLAAPRPISAGIEHFIAYGQSLSIGAESFPTLSRTPSSPNNLMMGLSVHAGRERSSHWTPIGDSLFRPLIATVHAAGEPVPRVLTDAEEAALPPKSPHRGETYLEGFAQVFRQAWIASRGGVDDPRHQFLFSACGVGGKTIAELSAARPHFLGRIKDCVTMAKAEAARVGRSYAVGAIILDQGQADYAAGTSFEDWLATAARLIAEIREHVASTTGQPGLLPIFLVQTGGIWAGRAGDKNELAIARAQIELERTTPGVFLTGGIGHLPRRPRLHLTSNASRWTGQQIGKVAARILIEGLPWKAPRMLRWHHRGRTLLGESHTQDGDLVIAPSWAAEAADIRPDDRGLHVEDEAGTVAVLRVEIRDGNLVEATLARDTIGRVKVWLGAYGGGRKGQIVFAARSRTPLPGIYAFDPGTGQAEEENIPDLVGKPYPADDYLLADVIEAERVP